MATPINKILINQIQQLSNKELAIVSASLSAILGQGGGGGGEPCASAWLPSVDENGDLSWTLSMSTTTPDTANIMGPRGPSGTSGAKGEDGTSIILQSVTDVEGGKQVTLAWGETPSTSSFVIPSGTNGTDGQDGENGTSVIVKSIREFNDTVGSHTKGGTEVTLEWTEDDTVKTSAFSAFNGEKGQDGAGASYTFDSVTMSGDGDTDPLGVNTNVIATQAWVGEQGYLTAVPDTYATKSYANEASAAALSQAQSWVGDQGFLKNTDLTDYATKTYANDASANALSQASAWVGQQGFITKDADDLTYYYKKTETSAATALSTEFAKYTIKPDSSLVDKYLVLRTDNAGNVSGWYDLQNQCYSKSEAQGTFVATANIDTSTLSGDGKSVSTKLGVNTDVIPTKDWLDDNYLPLSGGTVSGQLVVSATNGNFDTQFLKLIREGVNGYGRVGLGSNGQLAFKVDDSNGHTTQVNISPNASNDQLVQVQHGGTNAYLIPAITSTTTTGLTDDGILHIIVEN